MLSRTYLMLFFICFVFSVKGESTPEISVNVLPAPVPYITGDMSQRDERPPGPVYEREDGLIIFPINISPEMLAWKEKYTAQADLIVEIKNISSRNLSFLEGWNSWGFCNLKFVFTDGFHEYWVTKQPGLWYRNFPAWHQLGPGESFKIPVAFTERIWENIDKIKADSKMIIYFRALYEQYPATFPHLKESPVAPETHGSESWEGSVSSQVCSAKELLPRFNFNSRKPRERKFLLPSKEFLQKKKEQDSLVNEEH